MMIFGCVRCAVVVSQEINRPPCVGEEVVPGSPVVLV